MNLLDFCKDSFCEETRKPVNFEGHTYITDGRIGLRVPRDPQYEEAPADWKWPSNLRDWINEHMQSAILAPLPPYTEPPLKECQDCIEGKVIGDAEESIIGIPGDLDLSEYDAGAVLVIMTCPDCGGSGKTDKVPVAFGNLGISLHYLKLLCQLQPFNLRIDLSGCPQCRIPFAFDGGEGVLMPMRLK